MDQSMINEKFGDFNKYNKILIDLIALRESDYDAFMHRLYDALTGDFRNHIYDGAPISEKTSALYTMLEYFKGLEEYEKCAELKKIIAEIETTQPQEK